ncbi:MAG: class I SAM-dependent methyltransferase [Candidatus Heimdallarchaeota archaeon]|nr:MAG: class I SAM-dependent methyltransferase [Candidatus Heimdallarchaeota archaeon]
MRPFDSFPSNIQNILVMLEEQDRKEREDGLDRLKRLRQIPRETGEFLYQFLMILVPQYQHFVGLEIGTSGGYSTLWQAMALVESGKGKLISLDHDPKKCQIASKNIQNTIASEYITLIQADAKDYIQKCQESIYYVFLDAEKEDYVEFYELLVNRLPSGAILIADNVISHEKDLNDFLNRIQNDQRVSTIILPVGKGLALVRWR